MGADASYLQTQHAPTSKTSSRTGLLQRQGKQERCLLPSRGTSTAIPIGVQDFINSTDQPRDSETRDFMESRFDRDFSRLRVHADPNPVEVGNRGHNWIQRQLAIGASNDPLEQEADRVANQVSIADRGVSPGVALPRVQRVTHASPISHEGQEAAPPSVTRALQMPGRPLEVGLRRNMEARLGHDFSRVRVHDGAAADQSARDIDAQAYTVGSSVVFGAGRFAPGTAEGVRLIAHELAHVVQQAGIAPNFGAWVQRKGATHPRDRCETISAPANPCAPLSTKKEHARLKPFLAKAQANDFSSRSLSVVSGILNAPMKSAERARLLRIACCELGADDAKTVLESFSQRKGTGGLRFGQFATKTRCELISILENRAADVVKDIEPTSVDGAIRAALGSGSQVRGARAAEAAFQASRRFNLRDAQVLKLASDTVRELAGEGVMVNYLMLVDQALPQQAPAQERDPFEIMRVHRHGPYGTYFGVTPPILAPLTFLVYFAENIKAFVSGLRSGVAESVSEEDALAFGKRLAGSVVLTVLFPVPFLAGTAKGLWGMVKGFIETITNIREVIETLIDLFRTMFSPDGYAFAKAMGHGMGMEFGEKLVSMSRMNLVRFAYNLGELIGPAILMFVLSILGIPELAMASFSARLAEILGPVVRKFPRFARLVAKMRKGIKAESELATAAKAETRVAKEATAVEAEIAAGKHAAQDAAKFVEQHPGAIKGTPGHREANVGGGHKVVEVDDPSLPTGIACEYRSPPPRIRVNCPKGMGKRETVEEFKARGGKVETVPSKPHSDVPKQFEGLGQKPPAGAEDVFEVPGVSETKTPGGAAEKPKTATGKWVDRNAELLQRNPKILQDIAARGHGAGKIFDHDLPDGLVAEYQIPHPHYPAGARPRIDRLWRHGDTIFELKPNTWSAVKGEAQAQQYAEWMNRFEKLPKGRKWKHRVVTYDQARLMAYLKSIGVLP